MGDNWSILLNLSMYRWGGVFRVRLNILGMLGDGKRKEIILQMDGRRRRWREEPEREGGKKKYERSLFLRLREDTS